jgi:hypothetical protein
LNKASFGGYGKRCGEGPFRDMKFGLHDEESRLRLEVRANLPEKSGTLWYFVKHIAGKRKVDRSMGSDIVISTSIRMNSAGHVGAVSSLHHDIEYLLLEVDADDGTRVAYQTGHSDGEEPHATAKVEKRHSGVDVWFQNHLRLVEQATETVVE